MKIKLIRAMAGVAAFAAFGTANAVMLDLTSGYNVCLPTSGATVCSPTDDEGSTGSGTFPAFAGTTGGRADSFFMYNTEGAIESGNQIGNGTNQNKAVTLGDFAVVNYGGVDSVVFALDINQFNSDPTANKPDDPSLLSLDHIALFLSTDGALTGYDAGANTLGGESAAWSMDALDWIKLDYGLAAGSGRGDMFLYVPVSYFGGASTSTYLQLYSLFGATSPFVNNDGFEEWSYLSCTRNDVTCYTPPEVSVPEPGTLALLGLGLLGMGFGRRRLASR